MNRIYQLPNRILVPDSGTRESLLKFESNVRKLLPPGANLILTGGAVRDSVYASGVLPKDYDYYTTGLDDISITSLFDTLRSEVKYLDFTGYLKHHYGQEECKRQVLTWKTNPSVQLIQGNESPRAEDTTKEFDWVQCMWSVTSVDSNIALLPIIDSIDVLNHNILVLNYIHDPIRTLARGIYMAKRHSFMVRKSDIISLSALIALRASGSNDELLRI